MSVPVTKFSLRMYGSKQGVEDERARQKKSGSFVIHPYSNFRFYWDCVSLILLIVSMIVIPVAITFFNDKMTTVSWWMGFNLILDLWFLGDIGINFHTGIVVEYGDGDVILDLATIRRHYLKTWFIIDAISTLPIDYILQIVNMQYDLAVAAVRIFNLVCLILLIGHWNGCLQYMIPMLYDFPEDSWMVLDNLQNSTWGEKYSWSLFKAMSHMLCIGYGQQPPKNMMDLWMTMISMISGAVCFAMFIGHTTALIQSLDSSKRQYKEKYMQVKEYMRYRRLPKSLRMKVYEYYENRFQGKMFDEKGILEEVSPALQQEIVNFNCRHLVASVAFFRNAEQDFVNEIVQKLNYEVFQPTDIIMKEGSIGNKMYFMQHGTVEVRSNCNQTTTKLSDGSFFGEIGLITNERRFATVTALTICGLYSLSVDDFNQVLPRYPVMKQTLENVAASRLSKLGRCSSVLDRRVKQQNSMDNASKDLAFEIERHDRQNAEKQPSAHSNHNGGVNIFAKFRHNNIYSPNKKCHNLLRFNMVVWDYISPKFEHTAVKFRRSGAFDGGSTRMSPIEQWGSSSRTNDENNPQGFFRRIRGRPTNDAKNRADKKTNLSKSRHRRQCKEYAILESKAIVLNDMSSAMSEAMPLEGQENGGFDSPADTVLMGTLSNGHSSLDECTKVNNYTVTKIADVHADFQTQKRTTDSDFVIIEGGPKTSIKNKARVSYSSNYPLSHTVSLPTIIEIPKTGSPRLRANSYQTLL